MLELYQEPKDMWKFINKLERSFARRPATVALDLIGPGTLLPEPALILHEIIVARPPETRFFTRARSNLIDASVLPWLLGDRRELRRTGWVYLSIPRSLRRKLNLALTTVRKKLPRLDDDPFGLFSENIHYLADWEQVLRLIEQYLPLDEIAEKRLMASDLCDLGILYDNPIDRFLEALWVSSDSNPILSKNLDNLGPSHPRFQV